MRRTLVAIDAVGAVLLAALFAADAQQPGKVHRVGCLMGDSRDGAYARSVSVFLPEMLRRSGYVEGQNLVLEWRWGDGKIERLREGAADLIRLNMDVIIASSNGPIATARKATKTIPIVMVGGNVPVEAGIIESLARPGGNITGTTYTPPEVATKNLQLVKDFFPRTRRLSVVYDPTFVGMMQYKAALDRVAPSIGIVLHYVEVRRPDDFALAFAAIEKARPDALAIIPTEVIRTNVERLIQFAHKRKLPTFGSGRNVVDAGGILYYGPDTRQIWERSVSYVDRVLRGARPSELPVEQPDRYELIVNLKAARALNLTIAPALLQRADHVID